MKSTSNNNPYTKLASIYDTLFFALGKNYEFESQKIIELIKKYKKSFGNHLLDLGCGTGEHIKYLKNYCDTTGIDSSSEMLELAIRKNPEVLFLKMDMLNFKLDQKYDIVTCLFSAIGYLLTKDSLIRVVKNVSDHLNSGGIFIVEPWYSPEEIGKYLNLVEFGERQGIKACRMRETKTMGDTAKSTGHILISQDEQVKHYVSHHVFGLFSKKDFTEAFEKNGLSVCSMDLDLSGRGLFIGLKID